MYGNCVQAFRFRLTPSRREEGREEATMDGWDGCDGAMRQPAVSRNLSCTALHALLFSIDAFLVWVCFLLVHRCIVSTTFCPNSHSRGRPTTVFILSSCHHVLGQIDYSVLFVVSAFGLLKQTPPLPPCPQVPLAKSPFSSVPLPFLSFPAVLL